MTYLAVSQKFDQKNGKQSEKPEIIKLGENRGNQIRHVTKICEMISRKDIGESLKFQLKIELVLFLKMFLKLLIKISC